MGCNFSNKTINSIERKKNDIIRMTDIRHDVQLIKFIKMPNPNTGKFDHKLKIDDNTNGPVQSCFSVHSSHHPQSIKTTRIGRDSEFKSTQNMSERRRRTKNEGDNYKYIQVESNASIVGSESVIPTNKKIYDHWIFLQQHPYARLVSITCFGYNYITAIETKFEVPGQTELATFLYQGTMHEQAKKNELIKETMILEENEQIESVNCCCSAKNQRIRSITLGTNYENCLIMEGQIELAQIVNLSDSVASFSKIENESIVPESQAHLSERDEISDKDSHKDDESRYSPPTGKKSKIDENEFKYQDLDLSVYGRYLIGFKTKFGEYLEDIEVYTKKLSEIQNYGEF
ncbi:unnamed protein product [Moneuplotes crassus]|uniref:Uncharacterized protein n=1 Tax=Euplotes crassus TaxID=5936 RepID=A0AAD2CWU6_EUPCR|nr:unnamed protein product [Moneuplotes crassus]